MALIYPEGDIRSFAHKRDLSRLVDAHLVKAVSETSIPKTVLLEYLLKNRETFTGDRIEWPIYKTDGTNGASVFFNIHNATSDAVTATVPDAYILGTTDPKNAGRKIMLSKIQLAQSKGKEARLAYLKHETHARVLEIYQGASRALFSGNPAATNAAEFTGLDNTILATGSYGGLTRTTSRALVGNALSATLTANAVQTASSFSATNGSATLTKNGHGLTVSAGDFCFVIDDSNNERVYYITASDSNTITISPAYEGATDSSVSVRVQSPYNDTNEYGASGKLTLAKVDLARAMAIDGGEEPDLAVCSRFVWRRLRQLVLDTEHSVTKADLSRLGSSGVNNFEVNGMPVTMDNSAAASRLYMLNTKYLKLYMLKGYETPRLDSEGLITLATENAKYSTLVGETVMVGDLVATGVNRHAVLTNLSV